MSDEDAATLLDSDARLVLIEAPAGCGKTYQGSSYARRVAAQVDTGRILILTHTHAACGVFAQATRDAGRRVEIRTLDSLILQIAAVYHQSLDLPSDPYWWARQQPGDGFAELAARVSGLLAHRPMIGAALADRYPVIIVDEHQDSSPHQEAVIMSIHKQGARLRIFGDPMQRIYGGANKAAALADRQRWEAMKAAAAFDELDYPHRWRTGSLDLGKWILQARHALRDGGRINLAGQHPKGLRVLYAENIAETNTGYRLSHPDRKPLDQVINSGNPALILTGQNETANALAAFWGRSIPIWEGHTRDALGELVAAIADHTGDPLALCESLLEFLGKVTVRFSASSHGNRLRTEIEEGCSKKTSGKPALIQELGCFLLRDPNHLGVSRFLARLSDLIDRKVAGFHEIKIDYRREYNDAVRLMDFDDPQEGLAEINRRRTFARPMPPPRAISTIHKAKGLERENVVIMPCDAKHFSATEYSRCKLYVALSRAKHSLTLVVSRTQPSPLFSLGQ